MEHHQSEEQQHSDDDEKNDDKKKKKKKTKEEELLGAYSPTALSRYLSYNDFHAVAETTRDLELNGERLRNCCAKDAEREVRERNVRELLGCDAEEAKRMCEELEKDFADVPYDPARHFFPPTIAMGRPVAMSGGRQREHHRGEETVGGALMREIPPDGYRNPLFPSWYDRSPTNDRWRHGFGREYYADDDEEENERERRLRERERKVEEREKRIDEIEARLKRVEEKTGT